MGLTKIMKKFMKEKLIAVFVIVGLIAMLVYIPIQQKDDQSSIEEWALDKGHKVLTIDRHHFDKGPFWLSDKNSRVYKVKIEDEKTVWFKFDLFGTSVDE